MYCACVGFHVDLDLRDSGFVTKTSLTWNSMAVSIVYLLSYSH